MAFAQTEEAAFHSLSSDAREDLSARFGPAAEAGFELGKALDALRCGEADAVDREKTEQAVDELGRIGVSRLSEKERVGVARAWREAALYERMMEGPGPRMLERLEKALELDPGNEQLARDVGFERHRRRSTLERQAEAHRVREAMERGEDPYAGRRGASDVLVEGGAQ